MSTVRSRLSSEDAETRRLAIRDVSGLDVKEAGALLLAALGDDDWRVRKEAAAAARTVSDRAQIAAILAAALDDKTNIGLRNAVVEALASLGSDAATAAIGALERLDADGRKLAIEVLARISDKAATFALVRALADADPNVRVSAAEALGSAAAAGEEARAHAVEGLAAVLDSTDTLFVFAALESLHALDARLSWTVLRPRWQHPLLRPAVVRLAASSADPAADRVLAETVGSDSRIAVREAVLALAARVTTDRSRARQLKAELEATRSHPTIRALFEDGDTEVRGAAIVLMGVLANEKDIGAIIDALVDPDLEARAETAIALYGQAALAPMLREAHQRAGTARASVLPLAESLAPPQSAELLETARDALADAAPEVVVSALRVLSLRGTDRDLSQLAALASHADARIAAAAAAALHGIAKREPGAARALLASIAPDGELAVAGCAIAAALSADASGTSDAEWTVRALNAGDARTRRAAVDALATMPGPAARNAVALAVADEDREVQLAALRGLGRMGHIEALAALLTTPRDGELAATALHALGEIDNDRAEALAFPLVTVRDPAIACAAVETLARLGASRREDGLIAALGHADAGVVTVAISALAQAPSARAIMRLGTCLDHVSWEVRRLAAETLGMIDDAAVGPLLRARLNREDDPGVREAIHMALVATGRED